MLRYHLKIFCPDDAIDLWWKDKVRRPNQKRRRPYRKRGKHAKIGSKAAPKISEDISSSSTTTSADEIVEILSTSQSDTESSLDSSDSEVSSIDLLEGWDEWLESEIDIQDVSDN